MKRLQLRRSRLGVLMGSPSWTGSQLVELLAAARSQMLHWPFLPQPRLSSPSINTGPLSTEYPSVACEHTCERALAYVNVCCGDVWWNVPGKEPVVCSFLYLLWLHLLIHLGYSRDPAARSDSTLEVESRGSNGVILTLGLGPQGLAHKCQWQRCDQGRASRCSGECGAPSSDPLPHSMCRAHCGGTQLFPPSRASGMCVWYDPNHCKQWGSGQDRHGLSRSLLRCL